MLLVLLFFLYGCSTSDPQENSTANAPDDEVITSTEEINTMLKEAIKNNGYELKKFEKCDADILEDALLAQIEDDFPDNTPYAAAYADSSWDQLLRLWDIAEASSLSQEKKGLFAAKKQEIENVRTMLPKIREIYEKYGKISYLPSDTDYTKYRNASSTLHKLEHDYSNATYQEFYVRYELEGNWVDSLSNFFTGKNMIYYYANNVESYGLLGPLWGDEHRVLVVENAFAESGVYNLLVYQDGTVTLETTNGFAREAQVFYVINNEDMNTVIDDCGICIMYEQQIEATLKQVKSNWSEDENEVFASDVEEPVSEEVMGTAGNNEISDLLSGAKSFIDANSGNSTTLQTLRDVNPSFVGNPVRYTMCDIDNDSEDELLIEHDWAGDIALLDYKIDTWYAYYIPYRACTDLKEDGTFEWHYDDVEGYEYGIAYVNYSDMVLEYEDLFTSWNDMAFMGANYEEITQDAFEEALTQQRAKISVTWHDFP